MNHRGALLIGIATVLASGCLDPEPLTPPPRDGSTASDECLKCLASLTSGCGMELAACRAATTCSHGYDCTFTSGCVGGSTRDFVACLPGCSLDAGYGGVDDPGRVPGLAIYSCMTHGPCATKCFTDGLDDGGTPDDGDASIVDDGSIGEAASDAPLGEAGGGACTGVADEAIITAQDGGTIKAATTSCGYSCFGKPDMSCVATCLVSGTGLSGGCAACWGDSVNCAADKCLISCLKGSDDPDCLSCTAQFCTPAFHACSGN